MKDREEFEDLEDIIDVDIEENASDVAEDSDSSDDNVPLADLPCSKEVAGKYKFEKRRTFVPPTLPPFIPEKELPSPEERIPIEYICMFLTDDMLENFVFESNKYGTNMQQIWNSPNITKEELETFIGIHFLMAIIKMPNIVDYWNSSLRCAPIADKMSCNRFQTIHWTLHFVDNNRVTDDDKLDHVWKLRPWIKQLRANFSLVSCGEYQSIDEIMVAHSTLLHQPRSSV